MTDARFAVLTNGIEYAFYSDLDSPNKMDEKPFFEFDLSDYDAKQVTELRKFAKSNFDLDNILSNASELKYARQIKKLLAEEYGHPSEDFVRLFTCRVYSGRFTSSVHEQFRELVQDAFRDFVAEQVNDRLKSALRGGDAQLATSSAEPEAERQLSPTSEDDGTITTQEEIEGFHVVRAILARYVDPKRVAMRDVQSYCGVLLDDNNRKPICRLHFNFSNKYLGLFDSEKNEERIPIESPLDIYQHGDRLVATATGYDAN